MNSFFFSNVLKFSFVKTSIISLEKNLKRYNFGKNIDLELPTMFRGHPYAPHFSIGNMPRQNSHLPPDRPN